MEPVTQQSIQEIGTITLAVYVIVEVFKQAGFPSKYCGLLSIGLGVVIGAVSYYFLGKPWMEGVVEGFWGAASASGIYSGTKATFRKNTGSTDENVPPSGYAGC